MAADGIVFDDRNGNGRQDAGEPGLPSVAVSNGRDVARTDETGTYHLPERPGSRVFVIKPRGWMSPVGADELPRFYGMGDATAFPLRRSGEGARLRILVVTDPQPSSPQQIAYLDHGVVDRIGHPADIAFGVTLGDIVYDRPDLFGDVNRSLSRLGLPWFNLPGNHDLALGTPNEAAAVAPFEAVYGPSTYAFHAGPALFIALDDVRPQGGPRYIGGLTEDQFTFLENLLGVTSGDEWVVLMMHIPLFAPDPSGIEGFRAADRLRLFRLLANRSRVLVLSGHTHYQRHVFHGPADGWTGREPLHEYNVAAACGGFWGGPKDAQGIPISTMWDGTPPGYAVVGFDGDKVTLDYVPARLPADTQLSVHAPKIVAPRQGYVSFYANVFNGHDGWTVEGRVDNRAWNPLRRILGWDPTYAVAFLAQDETDHASAGTRLPDPAISYHLWRGALPADLAIGRHTLQVRATDPAGRAFVAEQVVTIAEP
jgi:hypothetical protein